MGLISLVRCKKDVNYMLPILHNILERQKKLYKICTFDLCNMQRSKGNKPTETVYAVVTL